MPARSAWSEKAAEKIKILLDEGKSIEDVIKATDSMDLRVWNVAIAISDVVYSHPRGEELRKAWNILILGKDIGEDAGGIADPTISAYKEYANRGPKDPCYLI